MKTLASIISLTLLKILMNICLSLNSEYTTPDYLFDSVYNTTEYV